jgi:hypothetical protein
VWRGRDGQAQRCPHAGGLGGSSPIPGVALARQCPQASPPGDRRISAGQAGPGGRRPAGGRGGLPGLLDHRTTHSSGRPPAQALVGGRGVSGAGGRRSPRAFGVTGRAGQAEGCPHAGGLCGSSHASGAAAARRCPQASPPGATRASAGWAGPGGRRPAGGPVPRAPAPPNPALERTAPSARFVGVRGPSPGGRRSALALGVLLPVVCVYFQEFVYVQCRCVDISGVYDG